MLQLNNPFIFAPIKLGYSDGSGRVLEKHLNFYKARNKHIGALTPEPLYMHKSLRELPTQLGIDDDDKIPGLKKLNAVLHEHGARSIAHLNHAGRMANPKIPGNVYLSSTDRACENGGAKPSAMTKQDIQEAVELFARSAKRAVDAGFDMIELQFGHGYLGAQFLSPFVNDREDEYGGSAENRQRFPLEVLEAVKKAVDVPVIVRISGDEMIPEGFHLEDMIRFSHALENHGASAVHVTAGTACSTPPWFFQHMFIKKGKTWDFAETIQQHIDIPVIYVGRINSRADVEKLKEKYHAEYIALGRALIADPEFTGKYLGQVDGRIRPCLACSEGCLGGVKSGQGLGCVVNPLVGKEDEALAPADHPKRIAVVGAGIAGMQAAITLKERGHDVSICEKDALGGQFNLAWLPPNKDSLKEILDYYFYEIKEKEIPVLKKEATPEKIVSAGYDEVVIATGAVPAVPPVKGLKKYYWAEFLKEENIPENENVLVIGGGLIGVEIASKLIDAGSRVTMVEMMDEIAGGMEMIERKFTMKKLQDNNTQIYLKHKVTEILEDKDVLIEDEKHQQTVIRNIDKIIIATGMRSENSLKDELDGCCKTHVIGDAIKPSKARQAIMTAYNTAKSI